MIELILKKKKKKPENKLEIKVENVDKNRNMNLLYIIIFLFYNDKSYSKWTYECWNVNNDNMNKVKDVFHDQ